MLIIDHSINGVPQEQIVYVAKAPVEQEPPKCALEYLRSSIPNFDTLPEDAKQALIASQTRRLGY